MTPHTATSDPDQALAEGVLAELTSRGFLPLIEQICAARGVTPSELCGRTRTRAVACARHELWWRIRSLPGHDHSVPEIATWFRRDHTTVFHGITAFEKRRRSRL